MNEKQGGQLISQVYGKENRPPKTESRTENIDTKRSSIPRIDNKIKFVSRKQFTTSKKSQSKKVNSSKLYSKSNSNL